MNDLTEEELRIILLEMDIVIKRTNKQGLLQISPIYFELRDKISSMIENYCEHSWSDAATDQFYCIYCQKHIDKV